MSSYIIIRMAIDLISIVELSLFLPYSMGSRSRENAFFTGCNLSCRLLDLHLSLLPLPIGAERVVITDKEAR